MAAVYDPLGRRVKDIDPLGTRRASRGERGDLAAVFRADESVIRYLYDGERRGRGARARGVSSTCASPEPAPLRDLWDDRSRPRARVERGQLRRPARPRAVVREVERCFEQARERRGRARRTVGAARGCLLRAFASAHRRVLEAGRRHPQHRGMLTTLAAMAVVRDRVVVAHLDDSRVYLLRGRDVDRRPKSSWREVAIERLTLDHTVAEDPDRLGPRPTAPAELQLLTLAGAGPPNARSAASSTRRRAMVTRAANAPDRAP